jgi:hypothetical protein
LNFKTQQLNKGSKAASPTLNEFFLVKGSFELQVWQMQGEIRQYCINISHIHIAAELHC